MGEPSPLSKFFPHLAAMPQHPPHPQQQHPGLAHPVAMPHMGAPHPHYPMHPSHVPPMAFNQHQMHMMADPRGPHPMGAILPLPSLGHPSSPSPLPPPGLSAPQMHAPISSSPASAGAQQHHRAASPARPSSVASATSRPTASSTLARKKAAPQQQRTASGERLPDGVEVAYQMEGQQPAYSQLEVTPITLLNSQPVYQRGSLIAVNHNYICYVVKGNMIRVINIFSAKRALLRGHTKGITDLRFCGGNKEDILASVAADGRLLVWRITEEATNTPSTSDEEAGIGHELVAAVRMEGERWSERVVWHPVHSHLLATAGNDQHAYVWDLKRIRQLKHATEDGKSVYVYTGTEPVDGVIRINVGAPINDLAFAPAGDALATASSDGRIQIWSASGGATPTPSLSWLAHETEAWGVVYHQNGKILITGGQHNAELCVWQLSEDEGTEPVLLQKIKFAPPPSGAIFNHIVLDSTGNYLFVANAKSTTFMVLHLQTQPRPRFDYITEFSVAQAILSFTVLNRGAAKPEPEMDLYCLQTKAIQMYHVTSNLCYAAPSPSTAAAQTPAAATPPGSGGAPAIPAAAAATSRSATPDTIKEAASSPAVSLERSRPESPSNAVIESKPVEPELNAEAESKREKQAAEYRPATPPVATTPEPTPAASAHDELAVPQPAEAKPEIEQRPTSPAAAAEPAPEPARAELVEEKPGVVTPAEPTENGHAEAPDTTTSPAAQPHPEEKSETIVDGTASVETVPVVAGAEDKKEKEANEEEAEAGKPSQPVADEAEPPAKSTETVEKKAEVEEASERELESPKTEELQPQAPETKEEPTPVAVAATPDTAPTTGDGELPQPQLKTPTETAVPVITPAVSKPSGASPSGRNKQPKKLKSAKSEGRLGQAAVTAIAQSPARAADVAAEATAPAIESAAPTGNLHAELKRMENSLLNGLNARMERALQQHADRQVAKAEKDRQERDKAERERQQRVLAAVTQAVNAGLAGIPQLVEKAVQKEIQAALVPAFGRLLSSMEKNLAKSLADDLKPLLGHGQTNGTFAQDLPPRLAAEVASRLPSANDIAGALQGSVRHAMEASFRSSFQETIIPSFQGSCQSMFQQIYGTMLPGLQQTIEEAVEPGLNKLASGDLRETLQSLTNAVNDLRELSARNAELFQTLSAGGRFGLQPPGSGLPEQQVTEAQLLQLLERDAYEQAFACALSERGAEAVRHLLQWIEPQGFFESGHGLSQIVMASLIHRVALDLQHDTPIKLDWLSHLLLHFHPMDTSIAAHSQHILQHTIHHLNAFLAAQPHHPLAINAKLLLHTANSLLSAPPQLATPSFSSLPSSYGASYL